MSFEKKFRIQRRCFDFLYKLTETFLILKRMERNLVKEENKSS